VTKQRPEAEAMVEITRALTQYFDGLYDSDVQALAAVFHPKAICCTPVGQTLTYKTLEEYLPVVAARPSPRSMGQPRKDAIERIELAGEQVAGARVRCAIGNKSFVDLLTLIRAEGRWQIVSKVFHFDEEPPAP